MNLFDILKMRGFDMQAKTKLLRHQDRRFDIEKLFQGGLIEAYQSVQGQDLLSCDYVVAFVGRDSTKACFAGIWRVIRKLDRPHLPYLEIFPYPELFEGDQLSHYLLEEVPGFSDLTGRLVIEWGTATRAWHQWLRDKPVVEILPLGRIKPFPGYLDFVLSFDELKDMAMHSDSNRIWHQMLASVAGIYLITDNQTGQHYVGSAYGKEGILGRWKTYVQNGHGGNTELQALLAIDVNRKKDFSYTVLRTLPTTLTQKEVIAKEQLYKLKLGSRVYGLNLN